MIWSGRLSKMTPEQTHIKQMLFLMEVYRDNTMTVLLEHLKRSFAHSVRTRLPTRDNLENMGSWSCSRGV